MKIPKELKEQFKEEVRTKKQIQRLHFMLVQEAEEQKEPCARCTRVLKLTVDHIVPQSLLQQIGIDSKRIYDEANVQFMCHPCNLFKANRLDMADNRTLPLLKKYIAIAESL